MFAIDHRQTRTQNLLATGEPSIDVKKSRSRSRADDIPPASLRPSLLPQDPDYLFLTEPAALHLSVSFA